MNFTILADGVRENMYEAHRGSFVEDRHLVLFGNDGLDNPLVTQEIELVLKWLRENGYKLRAMSSCSEGHSWIIVVKPGKKKFDTQVVDKMLWDTWGHVNGVKTKKQQADYALYRGAQYQDALNAIDTSWWPKGALRS